MQAVKIAAIQMTSGANQADNLEKAKKLMKWAVMQECKVLALPENFPFLSQHETEKLAIAEKAEKGPAVDLLREFSQQHKVWIVGGSVALKTSDPNKVSNTTLVSLLSGQAGKSCLKSDFF